MKKVFIILGVILTIIVLAITFALVVFVLPFGRCQYGSLGIFQKPSQATILQGPKMPCPLFYQLTNQPILLQM